MFQKKIIAASIALGLAVIGTAQAGPVPTLFTFDPTGTAGVAGDITGLALMDQAPGNVLAVGGGIPQLGAGVGTKVTDLYQANLGTLQDGLGNILYTNGGGGVYFTFAAAFGEVVTAISAGCPAAPCTANFGFDPSTPNFIEMNVNAAPGDNLAGTGFTTGTAILTGHIVAVDTNFTITNLNGGALDQSPNGDQRVGTSTLAGVGGGDIQFVVDSVNALYFPDLLAGTFISFGFVNTSLIDPFRQIDPSFLFSNSPSLNGNVAGNIGPSNGASGPNFQFQADANTSFARQAVPEPASLALLGIGLAGLGAFSRKRRKS